MAKKKSTRSTKSLTETYEDLTPVSVTAENSPNKKRWFVLVLILVLLVLAVRKGWIVAAFVNGKPIFRYQLTQNLISRFGIQTLEGMIGEALIADAARSANVTITQAEIESKEAEVVAGLGENVKLEDVLKFQGMTKEDFDTQIRLQMTVEKLLSRDVVISESDIDNFIATNSATLVATTPSELREEARLALFTQKVNEKIQPWFEELKQKAKILRFL